MPISNPGASAIEERERKRKRGEVRPLSRWRTDQQRRIYSSKLLDALTRVRRSTPTSSDPPRGRAVRAAADRALAATARGRTRWSRAILSGGGATRLRLRKARPAAAATPRKTIGSRRKGRSPAIRRKAGVLGRLVPGCRKLELPALLDEASDYIAALEVQVRAMTVLADILSASSPSAG